VRDLAEDAGAARALAERTRAARSACKPVGLDAAGIGIATQSFLPARLFHPVRVGWAMGSVVHLGGVPGSRRRAAPTWSTSWEDVGAIVRR